MSHGLEIRVPFLDRRVIDYVYALPGSVRVPDPHTSKFLLRRAFSDVLRPEITKLPKSGFTLPIGRWMAGPLREFCEASIGYLKHHGLLRTEAIDQIWTGFLERSSKQHWAQAFSLCVLGQYLNYNRIC